MPYYDDGPYAYFHDYSAVHDGSITTAKIANGAVTSEKLAPSLLTSNVRAFATVADMQAATDLVAGMTCHTNGFYSAGDDGAAYYTIDATGDIACANGLYATEVTGNRSTPPVTNCDFYDSFYISYRTDVTDEYKQNLIDTYFNRTLLMRSKVVLIVHISGDAVLEGLSNIAYLMQKCADNNVVCDTVKFHCTTLQGTTSIANYDAIVRQVLDTYPQLDKVWVFNEDISSADLYSTYLESWKSAYPNRLFGISLSWSGVQQYKNSGSVAVDMCDIVGYNYYPSVSTSDVATYRQFEDAFAGFSGPYVAGKPLYITECGIRPYPVCLYSPSNSSWTDSARDYSIVKNYMKAAIEAFGSAYPVYCWFSNEYDTDTAMYIGGLVKNV